MARWRAAKERPIVPAPMIAMVGGPADMLCCVVSGCYLALRPTELLAAAISAFPNGGTRMFVACSRRTLSLSLLYAGNAYDLYLGKPPRPSVHSSTTRNWQRAAHEGCKLLQYSLQWDLRPPSHTAQHVVRHQHRVHRRQAFVMGRWFACSFSILLYQQIAR